MSRQTEIHLSITPAQMDHYCQELCDGSANQNRKLAALMALEGFIVSHASIDRYSEPYDKILSIIESYSEQTRELLLRQHKEALLPALEQQDQREITRIHEALSRNGFDSLLAQLFVAMPSPRIDRLKRWVNEWCREAERAAQQVSGYPDAYDFRNTGYSIQQYQAMCELRRRLATL